MLFPASHFYSPVVDVAEIEARAEYVWQERTEQLGIDFRGQSHLSVLNEWFPRVIADYDYPDEGDSNAPMSFFNLNDQFSWLDARTLFVFLRHLRPRRMIEIGSGFSSLLVADVNRRFLSESLEFTCIEPCPRQFLKDGLPRVTRLIETKVQDVSPEFFDCLEASDILFIDSSHAAKTGSDVLYLFFEILPRLKPGVLIHIHDIFLPAEYPKEWVIDQNRSWNEQYLLQAMLMFSTRFQVVFGSAYAAQVHGDAVVKALARSDGHGISGEFWD